MRTVAWLPLTNRALSGDRLCERHGEPDLPDAVGVEPPQQRAGKDQDLEKMIQH